MSKFKDFLAHKGESVKKPGDSTHSAKWDRCVEQVKREGNGANAYAVCTAMLGDDSFKNSSSETEEKAQVQEFMRTLGISAAGSVPSSLLAEQDLEGETSKSNQKTMEIQLYTTKTLEKCEYCQGKVHGKKCIKCGGLASNETVKAAFEGTEFEDMIPCETYRGTEIMVGPEMTDTDGHPIGCFLLMGVDTGWRAFFSLQAAHEYVDSVFKAVEMTKSALGEGVFTPHEDIITEMRMNNGLDELTAQGILANVLEALGKGQVEETGKELEDSAEEAKHADEPTDTLVENIKNIQIKRQKATIATRERAENTGTTKSFQNSWKESSKKFGSR